MRQRWGQTFLRSQHTKREEDGEGGRKTRFSPTLTKMLFDLSDAVISNNRLKHCFIFLPLAFLLVWYLNQSPRFLAELWHYSRGQQTMNLFTVFIGILECLYYDIQIIEFMLLNNWTCLSCSNISYLQV